MTNNAGTTSRMLRRLIVAGLLSANVLVVVLSGYMLLQSRGQHIQRAEARTQGIAHELELNLSHTVERIDLALRGIVDELEGQLAGGGRLDEATMNAYVARLLQRMPEIEAFRVADADGRVRLGKGVTPAQPTSWADRDYFQQHRDHPELGLLVAKPRMGRIAKQGIVGFSRRYNDPRGHFAGVVSAPVAVEHFDGLLRSYDAGPRGTVVLRDAEAALIARIPPIPDQPAGQLGSTVVSEEFRALIESGVPASTFHTAHAGDGFERIVTYRRMARVPLLAIVGISSDDYLEPWWQEVYTTSALAGGFLLLSLVLGALLLRQLARNERDQRVLAEREAQLRLLVEAVPDAIQFKDGEGRWLIANSVCLRIFGLAGEAWRGKTDLELGLTHGGSCVSSDEAAWQGGQGVYRTEEHFLDADGRAVSFDVFKIPLFDQANRRQALVVVGRDVTERRQQEAELDRYRRDLEALVAERTRALSETEARATHILDSSAAGLYGLDAEGRIVFINPAACAMLGYAPEQAIGQFAHPLFHHSRPDGTPYPVKACASHQALTLGQKVRVDNEVYWHADGHPVPVMYATHPMMMNGRITGAVTSFVDVSEQRQAALAREQALNEAESLARVRSEFLANMSHEIRTPLHGVLGFAQIGIRHSDDPLRAHDAFAKILASGQRLLGVINDVLDFSKIEAGRMLVEQTPMRLAEVIDSAIDLVRPRADAKHLTLTVMKAANLPVDCLGDPLRIGQVLLNVLSNAVKFTEAGQVSLVASLSGEAVLFSVSDTGIGMSEAQLAQLFQPFTQADASATRRFGGTGLGLAISKRVMDLMQGSLTVRSQPGGGTTVDIRLPYVPTAGEAAPSVTAFAPRPADQRPLAGFRLLVAEDDPINRSVLEENLVEDGAQVVMVDTGREAVERVLADGRGAYDAILMDIQMPELDGYEATRRILELAPDLPVIAQTAHAFNEEKEKCLAAGMVDHVAKPIDMGELVQVLHRHAVPGKVRQR